MREVPDDSTVEAVVDADGRVRLLGEVHVSGPRRALVMVLEEPATVPGEATLLVEPPCQDGPAPRKTPRGRTCSRGSCLDPVPVLRPLADQGAAGDLPGRRRRGDWILRQVTSNPYGDPAAEREGRPPLR